jgi:hypothetical protein
MHDSAEECNSADFPLADRAAVETFYRTLFRHADPDTVVSLRAFTHEEEKKPSQTVGAFHSIQVKDPVLLDTVCNRVREVALNRVPAVFCPPVCTFKNGNDATEANVADGLVAMVECDEYPAAALNTLRAILGNPTLVMASGGEWTCPNTGKIQDKLHIHYRLREPARSAEDRASLKELLEILAGAVGSDPSATAVNHCLRWAGSWHTKSATPKLARIAELNEEVEIDLYRALNTMRRAEEKPKADGGRKQHHNKERKARNGEQIPQNLADLIDDGPEPKADHSAAFHHAVCWLWDLSWTAEQIEERISGRPIVPGRYHNRLPQEIARCIANAKPRTARARATSTGAVIRLGEGEIERAVDEAEDALIAVGGLYQRAEQIVYIGESRIATEEVPAQRIFPVNDYSLTERLSSAAEVQRFDKRREEYVPTKPPDWIAKTLQSRKGNLRFPVLRGIINAPTLRADGSLLDAPGYDARTGLFFDTRGNSFPTINQRPSREDAAAALELLKQLISSFPFVGDADRSVALSAIFTALVRPSLRTAPLHAFTAPVAGSGKSKLVDIASVITTGREAGVIPQGRTEEETEKRLGSLLLEAAPIVSFDNCEAPLGGEALCQALTQPSVKVRILGRSEAPELPTQSFIAATGNNLRLVGDMTRRVLLCALDPKVERPELRTFAWEPIARVKADRAAYVSAALTVLLAYIAAGRPAAGVSPLGSFEDWSSLVRNPLIWLGEADPVATMERVRELDPVLEELSAVVAQWSVVLGEEKVTVRNIIETATQRMSAGEKSEFKHPDFREALLGAAGVNGAINTTRLGKWVSAKCGRVVAGSRIERVGTRDNAVVWRLVRHEGARAHTLH